MDFPMIFLKPAHPGVQQMATSSYKPQEDLLVAPCLLIFS